MSSQFGLWSDARIGPEASAEVARGSVASVSYPDAPPPPTFTTTAWSAGIRVLVLNAVVSAVAWVADSSDDKTGWFYTAAAAIGASLIVGMVLLFRPRHRLTAAGILVSAVVAAAAQLGLLFSLPVA